MGCFSWPIGSDTRKLSLAPESMMMLLHGIDLKDGCKRTGMSAKGRVKGVSIYWIQSRTLTLLQSS